VARCGRTERLRRWVSERVTGRYRVAAVDCGTNSTRLLITDPDGSTRTRLMRITRLGEGVDATGVLAQAAIDRTIDALREFRHEIDCACVGRTRLVATSAARDAQNSASFLDAASSTIGAPAEILDGQSEGELATAGATRGLEAHAGDDIVLDIGGGSTELAVQRNGAVTATSLDIGCVRVSERFLRGDPPRGPELQQAASYVTSVVSGSLASLWGADGPRPDSRLIGLAGSVTTLAALELGLEEYDPVRTHHSVLTRDAVNHWCTLLGAATASERAAMPGIPRGREDVIVGGALILRIVMDLLGAQDCLVSETDLLDGLAMSMLDA